MAAPGLHPRPDRFGLTPGPRARARGPGADRAPGLRDRAVRSSWTWRRARSSRAPVPPAVVGVGAAGSDAGVRHPGPVTATLAGLLVLQMHVDHHPRLAPQGVEPGLAHEPPGPLPQRHPTNRRRGDRSRRPCCRERRLGSDHSASDHSRRPRRTPGRTSMDRARTPTGAPPPVGGHRPAHLRRGPRSGVDVSHRSVPPIAPPLPAGICPSTMPQRQPSSVSLAHDPSPASASKNCFCSFVCGERCRCGRWPPRGRDREPSRRPPAFSPVPTRLRKRTS